MKRWLARNSGVVRHPLVKRRALQLGAELTVGNRVLPGDERIGWGYKASGLWAKNGPGPFRLFEDGFVRSLRPGYSGGALYSIVEDRSGIYYDGDGFSDLIEAILENPEIDAAPECRKRFVASGASKYNWFEYEHGGANISEIMNQPGPLVVDQTAGDAAIRHGGGNADSFALMLAEALDSSSSTVYVRTHPDAVFRSRKSCFPEKLLRDSRIKIVPCGFAPWQVFPLAWEVFVFNSLLGMEALLHGCRVRTYGAPFYAGWGVTDDRAPGPLPRREGRRSVDQLFGAAYLRYSLYFDPDSGERCGLDRILEHLVLQKQCHARRAYPKLLFGFPGWKSRLVGRFLSSPGGKVAATRSRKKAIQWLASHPSGTVFTWGWRGSPLFERHAAVEDGFLRSVGLGADFHAPVSLIVDHSGMYFDASRSNDLEDLLANAAFSAQELGSARELIDFLVSNRLSKYNLEAGKGAAAWPDSTFSNSGDQAPRLRLLVPGQVENDASLRFGLSPFKSNAAFLHQVRRDYPGAVIAYKPHPDVVKKLRPGQAFVTAMQHDCDVVIRDLDIIPWLESCDAIATITSTTGFEGLLRGKKVACYGLPFYAGWGLTDDRQQSPRRARSRSIEELVAAALLRYPVYLNPHTGEYMKPEAAARFLRHHQQSPFAREAVFRALAAFKRIFHRWRSTKR